jgi:hypothetical protein
MGLDAENMFIRFVGLQQIIMLVRKQLQKKRAFQEFFGKGL